MQTIEMETKLTAAQVAEGFWELSSDEQVEFFAALDRLAGIDLCFQMAWVMNAIADSGNRDAQNGLQTMLAHAENYRETANDHRAFSARIELDRMARAAKQAVSA